MDDTAGAGASRFELLQVEIQVAENVLLDFVPGFAHDPPVWELRVGDFRVFYDVDEEAEVVNVRAVREKAHGQTTEDIA